MMPYNINIIINIYFFARIDPIFGYVGRLDSTDDICEDELSPTNWQQVIPLQVQGEGSRHAPTTSLHRGWVVWTNVGPVGTSTRGRPTEVRRRQLTHGRPAEVRRPAGLPADLPAVITRLDKSGLS